MGGERVSPEEEYEDSLALPLMTRALTKVCGRTTMMMMLRQMLAGVLARKPDTQTDK